MNPAGIDANESVAYRSSGPLRLIRLRQYALTILSVGVALGASLVLEHFHFRVPSAMLLLFAVAISSWYGGPGPALLALVLSTISFYWYFVEPVRTIYIYRSEIPFFIIFTAFAALLSWFGTVRRRVEADLRERAALLNLTHDTVFVTDMDGVIKYWNRGAEEQYGWTADQAAGRVVHDLLKTVFPAPLDEIRSEVTRTGRWEGELLHTKQDGSQLVAASRWSLERGKRGKPVAILETNNDITEGKRAEEALRRLNRELRAISDCNQTLLRATDEQSLLEKICRIVCEEAGYCLAWVGYAEHDEAKSVRPVAWTGAEEGYLASAGITWADTERGRGPTGTAIRSGKTCCIQDFATDPRLAPWREGLLQRGFRSGIALPLKDEPNNAFGSLTIHSAQPNAFTPEEIRLLEELAADLAFGIVTLRSRAARKQAEQKVSILSFALNNVREAALLIDETARIQYVNDEACRGLGYTRAELLGMSVPDIDPEFPTGRWSDHWRDLKAQRSLSFESRHRTKDGRTFPVEISANYFEYGGRAYNLGLVRDITERKHAEEALQRSEAYLAEAERISHSGSWAWNPAGGIQHWSKECYRIMGFDPAEGLPPLERFLERIHPKDLPRVRERLQRVAREKTNYEDEYRIVRPSGEVRDLHVIGHPVFDSAGNLVEYVGTTADVADRKRSEEALRRSEAYLSEAQRLSHTGSWALDVASDKYAYVSEECLRIYGFEPQQGLPSRDAVFRRIHPEDLDRVKAIFEKSLREKVDTSDELRIVLPDGAIRHLQVTRKPVLNEAGHVVRLVGTSVDITERKRAEEALLRTAAYLAETQRLTHTGTWVVNPVTEPLYWSEELFRIFGFDPQHALPTRDQALQRIHPEDRDKFKQAFDRAIHAKVDADVEYRIVLPDGTMKYAYGQGHPVLNAQGELVEMVGTTVDITERKRSEEALRRSEAYLSEAQRLSHTGSFAFDVACNQYVYISEECFRIFELDAQQSLPPREAVSRFIHPEDWDRARGDFEKLLCEKVDTPSEFRIVLPSGAVKHIHVIRHPVLDGAGEVVTIMGTAVDITERKRAEEALRESETRFRTFVDHAGDALFVYDLEQRTIVDVNRRACEELGYTREELIGNTPLVFHQDSYEAEMESDQDRAARGETVFNTHVHRRKDGTVFPVEVQTSLLSYGGRRFLLNVARDITDRVRAEEHREKQRQLEAELAHLNRVSMLGELTASIAHEINQPLSGIVSNASASLRFLAGDAPNVEEAREAARDIVRDGKRAGEVVARIRALTRRTEVPREKLDLNETIQEVLTLVGDEAKKSSVIIGAQLADDISPVLGDRVQLQQVVLNLIMNGIEAMSSIAGRARELAITTQNIEPDRVQVTVQDSGVGLDPDTMPRIFDPFFTTKACGMGMGLSICRSILQAHGGQLWAAANEGPGTSFHFTLPRDKEGSHAAA